jgi:hypothetical protein
MHNLPEGLTNPDENVRIVKVNSYKSETTLVVVRP